MHKSAYLAFILIFVSLVAGYLALPYLPDQVASHWNIQGMVDGYMPKVWGAIGIPLMMLAVYLIINLFVKLDPLKKNIQKSKNETYPIILSIIAFLTFIQFLVLAWNLGLNFSMTRLVVGGLSFLIFLIGFYLPKVKPNWTVGVRTPWTLSSPQVWEKTHVMAGRMFRVSSLIIFLSLFFPANITFIIFFTVIILSALIPSVFSYLEFKKTK